MRYLQGRHCASTPLCPFFLICGCTEGPIRRTAQCIAKTNIMYVSERGIKQSHEKDSIHKAMRAKMLSFPHDSGFVVCPSVRKASMTCDSDLESLSSWTGSSRVAWSSFLPRNLPPCFDSSSTSHIFLPTGCVLRGVNFGLFAFRDEVAVCPF